VSATRYSTPSRALHWISAILIIALVAVGLWMTGLADEDPSRRTVYNLHKSIGVLTLILLIARLLWLRLAPAPALPAAFSAKEKRLITGLQTLLYGLMLLVPFSGYLMSTAKGYPVPFFGLFNLPALIGKSETVAGFAHAMHELSGYLILAIVLVHAAGAIKHRLGDRDGPTDVLARML
jgi:cytochrome b561